MVDILTEMFSATAVLVKRLWTRTLNCQNQNLFLQVKRCYPMCSLQMTHSRWQMMKPFSQIGLSSERIIFNYRLSRARRVVENVFGILVSRFGVLQRAIQLSPEKAETVVLACCYLHNFLRRQCGDKYISGLLETENTGTGSINHGSWRTRETFSSSLPNSHSRNASNNAKTIREEFRDYFNHENIVPWQNKFVN